MTTRTRRWWIGGGLALLVLALLVLAPVVAANVIESRLHARFGSEATVGDVDVRLRPPGFAVEDLRFSTPDGIDVEAPEIIVTWSWMELFGSRPRVELRDPKVRVRVDPGAPPEANREPMSFSDLRSLHVVEGAVTLDVQTRYEPVEVAITEVEATVRNTAKHDSSDLTAHFEITASVGPTGRLQADGAFIPSDPRQGWSLEFALEDVDVVPLNPLWNAIVEMDTSAGSVSLRGNLGVSKQRLRGRVVPRFSNLRMLERGESARHPMGEALFSEMLSGADNAMMIDVPTDGGPGVSLASLMENDWEAVIEGVIERGYQRQLDTLTGYASSIGSVDVDFSAARLVLHDVAIFRDTGLVEAPFIRVAELDVRFDESVAEQSSAGESYKHVIMREPVLTFVAHPDEDRRQMQFDPQWPTKVSSLPFQTADLVVEEGTIRFIEHLDGQTHEIAVEHVALDGRQMARSLSPPGERRASIEATGMLLGESQAHVSVQYEPASEEGNTHFELELQPLALASLNPLARTHAGIDASAGTIGVSAVFDTRQGTLEAAVTLALRDVQLIGEDEAHIEHPIREFLLTQRLRKIHDRTLRVEVERDDRGLFEQVGVALLREVLDES